MKRKNVNRDFEEASLPNNRKELFFDVVKLHWRTLLILASVLFLGLLPFMACLFFRDNIALSYSIAYAKGEIDEATRESFVRSVRFYASLGEAASLFIFSIPLAGSIRVLRQLAWLEPVFFKEDFAQGIKDNYKTCAISSFVIGLLLIGTKAMNFTSFNNVYLIAAVIGLFVAFVLPPLFLSIAQGSVYTGKFSRFFSNAVAMYFKHAPILILFTGILVAPFLLELIQNSIPLRYILMAVVVFVVPALGCFLFLLASYSIFDEHINKESYPSIYRKGLMDDTKNDAA